MSTTKIVREKLKSLRSYLLYIRIYIEEPAACLQGVVILIVAEYSVNWDKFNNNRALEK